MAESPMVGARVPQEWQQQISAIAAAAGRKEADVVREALGQYLGKNDPGTIKGAIASLEDRVADLERKLAGNGRLVGE
jgi:RHH-type rel operon transcriptional repressor/antitoxin RelB